MWGAFLSMLRAACEGRDHIRLGFELPDVRRILAEGAFWDVYYEHCSYFTAGSLARAFGRAGFETLDLRLVYGGQYLIIEAAPASGPTTPTQAIADDLAETAELAARFRETAGARVAAWRARFAQWTRDGRKVALWGSGSKAVGFLTAVGGEDCVSCVVDINSARHGAYMPGCPMPIVGPKDLPAYAPHAVIAMNPVYRKEIGADLAAMGLDAPLLTVEDALEPEGADARTPDHMETMQ